MTMPKFEPVGLPDLPAAVSKGNLGTYLFDTMHMHQYAMRYLDLHAEQLTEAYEAGKREQADELEAARAEIENVQLVSQLHYDANLSLRQQLAAEQAKNVKLLDFIARAQVSSGVCCCGDTMDGHPSPMSCGHSPIDVWDHAVGKLLDAPSDTSALEAIVKKAGEVMREECITAAGPEDSYQDDWIRAKIDACDAIRALPAVTLEDLK